MFAIEVTAEFCAAHQLRLPARLGGGVEALHGHNWRVTVRIEAAQLDDLETVVDFHGVERALREVLGAWNNRNLNDIPPFDAAVNPSAERVAERIGKLVSENLGVNVAEVRVTEAPDCIAIWRR
jgi:6-pyruvoyltetrahydropterin/6-carboxytetrahydropterin synthase